MTRARLRPVEDRQRPVRGRGHPPLGAEGITANAVHPGAILETNLSRHVDAEALGRPSDVGHVPVQDDRAGRRDQRAGRDPAALDGIGGRYFEDCNEAPALDPISPGTGRPDPGTYGPMQQGGVAAYALDSENASRLWDVSLAMLGRE